MFYKVNKAETAALMTANFNTMLLECDASTYETGRGTTRNNEMVCINRRLNSS